MFFFPRHRFCSDPGLLVWVTVALTHKFADSFRVGHGAATSLVELKRLVSSGVATFAGTCYVDHDAGDADISGHRDFAKSVGDAPPSRPRMPARTALDRPFCLESPRLR